MLLIHSIWVCVCGDHLVKLNQLEGAIHIMFFKKAVNCELPVPTLLAMCELAIFYTLYCLY
jgi:hypothetical protein